MEKFLNGARSEKNEENKTVDENNDQISSKADLKTEDSIKDLEDKLARAYAEIENQRRRFEKEKDDIDVPEYLVKITKFSSSSRQTIEYSKKLGATDVNVEVVHSISETVNLRNKQLDESNRSDSFAIGITTYINKKKSTISSSNLSKDNIKILTERCIETAKITPDDEFNSLPDKELMAKNFESLDLYDEFHVPNNKKIDILKEAEEAASKETKIMSDSILFLFSSI